MNYITWESFGSETLVNPLLLFGVVLELGVDYSYHMTAHKQWILPRDKVVIVAAHVGIVPIQRVMDDGNRGWYRVARTTHEKMKMTETSPTSPLRKRLEQIAEYRRSVENVLEQVDLSEL